MSDWDEEDQEFAIPSIPVLNKGAWDDEDADDDEVKASWEDSDEDEPKKEESKPVVAAPVKKKKTIAQKLAERKAEEERKKAELATKRAENNAEQDNEETPEERKARLQRAVLDSDLENAKDLFGGISAPTEETSTSKIETMNPNSQAEFDDYEKACMEKFSAFDKKTHYSYFVESLIRDLLVPLNVDDTRRISSSITAMINEKQKAQKEIGKKKKGKKATLKTTPSGDMDTTNYDDVYDEFEDFM
ncbi:hypothetical protein SpCBS45565_g01299 [Spizellomyces sp. 'palustris']|nr:hypothetical protein SpCBS45565_g01299 [Spizellomyces sp. 'palustris']